MIETERLILRAWKDSDIDPYFQINQDAKVLEFLLGALTIEEVKNFLLQMNQQLQERNFTLWAVENRNTKELMGFVGLNEISWESHFTPAIEIGWRLGSQFWGQGYATEAALAALNYGFNHLHLKEIVAFTFYKNKRSIRVMEKIGMKHDIAGDFCHPKLALDHPLSRHVLFRIS